MVPPYVLSRLPLSRKWCTFDMVYTTLLNTTQFVWMKSSFLYCAETRRSWDCARTCASKMCVYGLLGTKSLWKKTFCLIVIVFILFETVLESKWNQARWCNYDGIDFWFNLVKCRTSKTKIYFEYISRLVQNLSKIFQIQFPWFQLASKNWNIHFIGTYPRYPALMSDTLFS